MAATLYVETNFLISHAKGQDEDASRLLLEGHPTIHLAIPAICFMEALTVFEAEQKVRGIRNEKLKNFAREVDRDRLSSIAPTLARDLKSAIIVSDEHLDEIKDRLNFAMSTLSRTADFIELTEQTVASAITSTFTDDPTDNLILACVAGHATNHPDAAKAFVSANAKDYKRPDVLDLLDRSGVRYFSNVKAALGWLAAAPET